MWSMHRESNVFNVPEAGRYRLRQAPLAQALVQISFPLLARFQTLDGVAGLQEQLIGMLPYMEREQVGQIVFGINPDGTFAPGPQESTVVWKFTDDAGWTLAITPGSAILAVGSAYQGIDDFAQRFTTILDALANMGGPAKIQRCDRLGVRYIDAVASPPDDSKAWSRWFKSELTGWTGDGVMGDSTTLLSQINQTQLIAPLALSGSTPSESTPLAVQGLIRHGLLPPGSVIPGVPPIQFLNVTLGQVAYTVDIDLSIQQHQPFTPATLSAQFKALHAQIDAFFKWTLTREGMDHFGLEQLP